MPGAPADGDRTCDWIDDDCDGADDEDYAGAGTECGQGACTSSGVERCVDGVVIDTCEPGAPADGDRTCDGIDDDCDGSNDEDFAGAATECGLGACASSGVEQCVNGVGVDTCEPGAPADGDRSCDGVDNDCDGVADEDCPCGGAGCPEHPLGWPAWCNPSNHCEYAPQDGVPHREDIYVPPGAFEMGAPENEADRNPEDGPIHPVIFDRGYFIAKHEVTAAQYEVCETEGPCTPPSTTDADGEDRLNRSEEGRGDHPQNGVSWAQAQAYCQWTGGRLQSEAEWEYAAAGPVHRRYPWGDDPDPTCANGRAMFREDVTGGHRGCDGLTTVAVGEKATGASYVGAVDMAGNVWEWAEDCWHDSYEGAPPDGSAWVLGCTDPERLVTRGGAYLSPASSLRTALRNSGPPDVHYSHRGVRCARDVPPANSTLCDGAADPPCNGCPVGVVIPEGWSCIPPGGFWMGSSEDESGRRANETRHRVRLTRPYLSQTTEVTREAWIRLMGADSDPSAIVGCGEDCPVEQVTWFEAVAYANALSRDEGLPPCYADPDDGSTYDLADATAEKNPEWPALLDCRGYRLPTDAEWERAARAGEARSIYGPGDPLVILGLMDAPALDPIGWYGGNSGVDYEEGSVDCSGWPQRQHPAPRCGVHPVGQKRPNAWGLFDAIGNVYEWVWDGYDDAYGGIDDPGTPVVDPLGPEGGGDRPIRGGAWTAAAALHRFAHREGLGPGVRSHNVGFRPVRSLSCALQPEICDGVDNDCDGEIDERFPTLGEACSVALGECRLNGVVACNSAGDDVECDVEPLPDEVCDGVDNNCDGQVDEGYAYGVVDPSRVTVQGGTGMALYETVGGADRIALSLGYGGGENTDVAEVHVLDHNGSAVGGPLEFGRYQPSNGNVLVWTGAHFMLVGATRSYACGGADSVRCSVYAAGIGTDGGLVFAQTEILRTSPQIGRSVWLGDRLFVPSIRDSGRSLTLVQVDGMGNLAGSVAVPVALEPDEVIWTVVGVAGADRIYWVYGTDQRQLRLLVTGPTGALVSEAVHLPTAVGNGRQQKGRLQMWVRNSDVYLLYLGEEDGETDYHLGRWSAAGEPLADLPLVTTSEQAALTSDGRQIYVAVGHGEGMAGLVRVSLDGRLVQPSTPTLSPSATRLGVTAVPGGVVVSVGGYSSRTVSWAQVACP